MSRRRRTLSILVLLIFLISLGSTVLSAREPDWGPEDFQISDAGHYGDFGDDDDDGANIQAGIGELIRLLCMQLSWIIS